MKKHIDALIFDFGGVLTLPQDPGCLKTMAELCGVTAGKFREAYITDRLALDRGDMEVGEYYERILGFLADDGKPAPGDGTIPRLLELDLYSWARENTEMAAFVRRLKAGGYPLGLLSNMPSYFLPKLQALMPAFRLFDAEVFSCDAGLVKPEPAIYLKALEALGAAVQRTFQPEQVLFIDDMAVNAEAAEKLGFQAVCFTGYAGFMAFLKDNYDLPV